MLRNLTLYHTQSRSGSGFHLLDSRAFRWAWSELGEVVSDTTSESEFRGIVQNNRVPYFAWMDIPSTTAAMEYMLQLWTTAVPMLDVMSHRARVPLPWLQVLANWRGRLPFRYLAIAITEVDNLEEWAPLIGRIMLKVQGLELDIRGRVDSGGREVLKSELRRTLGSESCLLYYLGVSGDDAVELLFSVLPLDNCPVVSVSIDLITAANVDAVREGVAARPYLQRFAAEAADSLLFYEIDSFILFFVELRLRKISLSHSRSGFQFSPELSPMPLCMATPIMVSSERDAESLCGALRNPVFNITGLACYLPGSTGKNLEYEEGLIQAIGASRQLTDVAVDITYASSGRSVVELLRALSYSRSVRNVFVSMVFSGMFRGKTEHQWFMDALTQLIETTRTIRELRFYMNSPAWVDASSLAGNFYDALMGNDTLETLVLEGVQLQVDLSDHLYRNKVRNHMSTKLIMGYWSLKNPGRLFDAVVTGFIWDLADLASARAPSDG